MLAVESIDLFYGAAQALRSVSFEAKPGRVTCVLGRNGVGKTSLMRAIIGHQGISSGRIMWDGADVAKLAPHQRARRGIAYVPQGREIFPLLSVRENLETGYAPLLWRRGGDLSGGQQQQLAIGRALVTRPRLLVLDEPTEGIQPSIIKDIGRAIEYLREKGDMAIVLVEQYFDFARELADDFIVMDRGAVVMSGDKASMVESQVRSYMSV